MDIKKDVIRPDKMKPFTKLGDILSEYDPEKRFQQKDENMSDKEFKDWLQK